MPDKKHTRIPRPRTGQPWDSRALNRYVHYGHRDPEAREANRIHQNVRRGRVRARLAENEARARVAP